MKIKSLLKVMFVTYLFSAVLLILLAAVLYKFGLSAQKLRLGVMAIYCLSGFLSGFLMGKIVQTKKYLWGVVTGLCYFAALAAVSLILHGDFQGNYKNILMQLALCLASGMIGGALA